MTPRHECPTPGPAMDMAARFAALVPVLETERLTLRAPLIGDFPAYAEVVCSERGRYVGGPMSRDDAWSDYIQFASCWYFHGHGGWTAVTKSDDRLAGFVILGLEPGDREVELGFIFREAAEGRGLAFEAATAARSYARDTLSLDQLVSYVDEGNTRSHALAERLGARRDGVAEAELDGAVRVYRHPGPEALQ